MPERPAGSSAVRRAGAHRAPRSARGALVLGAVLVLLVAAAAVLLWGDDGSSGGGAAGEDPASDRLADWAAENLPEGTGLSDAGLEVVTGDPPAGALVLTRVEQEDGSVLSVVDPEPGRPTADELDRRRRLADAVLANPLAAPSGRAADVLRAGDVDARLLGLLAGLVGRLDAHVADLPPAPGAQDDGPPVRHMLVDRVGDEPLTPGSPATGEFVAHLEAQRAPFSPDTVEVTDDGVLVGFDYVSAPDAVVTDATT